MEGYVSGKAGVDLTILKPYKKQNTYLTHIVDRSFNFIFLIDFKIEK